MIGKILISSELQIYDEIGWIPNGGHPLGLMLPKGEP